MHIVISIAIGALTGLLAALATKTASWVGYAVDVVVGVVGALPAAWFLEPLGSGQSPNRPEIAGAFFGAVFLLALVKLVVPRAGR
jgi:uncharacterized membrane protein YeaQ/YmgE (transglycosylase-associated protein family)